MMNRSIRSSLVLSAVLLAAMGQASAGRYDTDKPGGADYPLITRYAGSTLYFYGGENYGTAPMLVKRGNNVDQESFEGKVSNRLYWGPKGRSSLEIFRNYQAALRLAGFETVYQCETAQCEKEGTQYKLSRWVEKSQWTDRGNDDYYLLRAFQSNPGFHYLHARKRGGSKAIDVQVAVRRSEESDKINADRVLQFIQVVEAAEVEQGNVTVNAATIASALEHEGKVALYGIYFDTNQAVIKPQSAPALTEMAAALKNSPALNVFIVGHTDNQGGVDANVALSRRRAQAVVDALSTQHGVVQARLQAQGVASFAPVASNASEAGRALNRRVEMVVR
jgi:outer membrane protein OmpA-like peptidoglycan-associated protein